MKQFFLLVSALLLMSCSAGPVGNPQVPEPAKPVVLEQYLGRWYEIGRYENWFERHCEAVTADYALREDGLISVVNRCREGGLNGQLNEAKGKAKILADTSNAKLAVTFFGPFFLGDYWVLDHADDYSWSIVGEPSGRYLWLLFRDSHPSAALKKRVWRRTKALGYDTDLIRETTH